MASFTKTKSNIKRSGRIGYISCKIAGWALIFVMILHVIAMVIVWHNEKTIPWLQWIYENNTLYRLLSPENKNFIFLFEKIDILKDLSSQSRAEIGLFVSLLTVFGIWLVLRPITKMMQRLSEGERPFNVKNAKSIRRYSYAFLLLILYNPLFGIVGFILVRIFSNVIEYGGYIQEQADETNRIQEEMIVSFAEITENKSGQTGQHIKRVSEYSRILAEQMGLDPENVEKVRIASTMHDVGKLLIPSEILEKPGKLTDEEYSIIKQHTTYGGQLLENVEGDVLRLSRTIALQHHERFDGKGYPASLSGKDISPEGQIVSVADVYDALTSKRSYKDAWSEEDAFSEIIKGRGTQFAPDVVDAFEQAHDRIKAVREQFKD